MESIIEVKDVSFSYPQARRHILNRCSFAIGEGELLTILGPNGAGKSTLLNCSCGLLVPESGEICLCGKSITGMDRRDIARTIAYVQQNQRSAFPHSVFEYVLMGRACKVGLFGKPTADDRNLTENVLREMDILKIKDAAITEISGGERQQAAIARAIVQHPKAIFFDEPTAHLDYGNQINTLRLIAKLRDQGFAIVMTTHNPDHCMMLGGKVAILNHEGSLEVGEHSEILTEKRLQEVYHTQLRITYIDAVKRVACIPAGL